LIACCLGYALVRGGQSVLMIDGDPATDGLSLFLLGPKGMRQISAFDPKNTFTGILHEFQQTGTLSFEAHPVHRTGEDDHGVSYNVIISGRGLYGDEETLTQKLAVPDLEQSVFRAGVKQLFDALRASNQYSYVLVDTRGGFAFESTDVCALADSFIVVTEPDYTSFYQDRNLVRRISRAAQEVNSPSVLRSFIVNKATEGGQQGQQLDLDKMERSFRLELGKEFPVRFEDTHPIPVDVEALKSYKTQRIPYVAAPASLFSFATLTAFADILQVVTSRWTVEQVEKWNDLVNHVSNAVGEKNKRVQQQEQDSIRREKELSELRVKAADQSEKFQALQREMSRMEKLYERALEVSSSRLSGQRPTEESDIKMQSEKLPWFRRNLLFVILSAVIAIIFAGGYLGLNEWRQSYADSLLSKVYDKSQPPALRSAYLVDLVNRYGRKQFQTVNLDGVDLSGASLRDVRFPSASLNSANFKGADLSGADLSNASLQGADLSNANLSASKLLGAHLQGALLKNANFRGTDIRGADLRDSDFDNAQAAVAIMDQGTLLPNSLHDPMSPGTSDAWSLFNKGQFDAAYKAGVDCALKSVRDANQKESALVEKKAPLPPTGAVSDEQKQAILAYGALNDVATCFWIAGRSAEQLKNTEAAKGLYKSATKYKYARTWDPDGWFWSPAQDASDRLVKLNQASLR
jgi:uncharacterized protein YjbI with pentapeptide repeats/cellulose biosynthesis protein BcsQ